MEGSSLEKFLENNDIMPKPRNKKNENNGDESLDEYLNTTKIIMKPQEITILPNSCMFTVYQMEDIITIFGNIRRSTNSFHVFCNCIGLILSFFVFLSIFSMIAKDSIFWNYRQIVSILFMALYILRTFLLYGFSVDWKKSLYKNLVDDCFLDEELND